MHPALDLIAYAGFRPPHVCCGFTERAQELNLERRDQDRARVRKSPIVGYKYNI